jgi:sigma-B regulation protein RsbU (phosphoserine phosphatase)
MKVKKDQIELAARLHYGFLPRSFANGSIDAAVELHPFRQIGGDYCSIFQARKNRVIFGVCDVVGHTVASALVAARVNTFVMTHAMEAEHPCELIEPLNSFLCRNVSADLLFTSYFSLIMDLDTREISYAGAGHPPALHYRAATHDCVRLESATTPLGIEDPLPIPCTVNSNTLEPGDRILLYTDGLIDMQDKHGNPFSMNRIEALLMRNRQLDARDFCNLVFNEEVHSDRYTIQDDILLMTICNAPAEVSR